jgi:hypothetical protein
MVTMITAAHEDDEDHDDHDVLIGVTGIRVVFVLAWTTNPWRIG